MAKNSCELYPIIKGKPSKLYKDLLKVTGNRPKANYIYAVYLQSGVAAQMDSLGYSRNDQGEHKIADVEKHLDVMSFIRESTEGKVSEVSRTIGATELGCNSKEIYFTSCGRESDNLALKGIAYKYREKGGF